MEERELNEQIAYVRGLMEGMQFDKTTNEGKIIAALVDVVDAMARTVTDIDNAVEDLYEGADELRENMDDLESYVFEDDEDGEDEDYEDGMYEITCPNCGETVCLDEDMLSDENLSCPNCGAEFEIGFSDEEDDACAGCSGCEEKKG